MGVVVRAAVVRAWLRPGAAWLRRGRGAPRAQRQQQQAAASSTPSHDGGGTMHQ